MPVVPVLTPVSSAVVPLQQQEEQVIDPDVLRRSQRLAEFDDETKRAAARANIGLQDIDLGTFG